MHELERLLRGKRCASFNLIPFNNFRRHPLPALAARRHRQLPRHPSVSRVSSPRSAGPAATSMRPGGQLAGRVKDRTSVRPRQQCSLCCPPRRRYDEIDHLDLCRPPGWRCMLGACAHGTNFQEGASRSAGEGQRVQLALEYMRLNKLTEARDVIEQRVAAGCRQRRCADDSRAGVRARSTTP